MNAIAQTIKASQDTETARQAAEAAKAALQLEIYADARARVAKFLDDFNTMPMELQDISDGTSTGKRRPLYTGWGVHTEYTRIGRGLRFFLVWCNDGRSLALMLNCKSQYVHNFVERDAKGAATQESMDRLGSGEELMTLAEAQRIASDKVLGFHGKNGTSHSHRTMGHITRDGGFALHDIRYDEDTKPTPTVPMVEWITKITGSLDIAPFVVLQPAPDKKGKKK